MTETEKDVTIEHSLDNIQEASKSANQVPYKASEAEKPLNIINVFDLELEAKKLFLKVVTAIFQAEPVTYGQSNKTLNLLIIS